MRPRMMAVTAAGLLGVLLIVAACDDHAPTAIAPQAAAPTGFVPANKEENPATDRMTGGCKLGDDRDFATCGFEVRPGKVNLEWVQHCLDGASDTPTCQYGQFTFHSDVLYTFSKWPGDPDHCRAWTGQGTIDDRDNPQYNGTYNYTVDYACDYGEPGVGTDRISITIGGAYHREGTLTGGNLQLHKAQP